ncbi:hypothetical protein JCM8547_006341 [Rhodosporidiobolus lusitaniae]
MASPLPSRKRSPTSFAAEDNDNDDALLPPPPKKRAPRSTAAEKAQKKLARMERNRIAAQASRDRKKQHTEVLECRIAELEAQLASSAGTPPSSSSLLSPSATASPAFSASPFTPSVALPPLPSLPLAPAQPDATTVQLREENESLKTQLALEKLQSQALQIRLSALESKFGRLEQLLSGGGSLGSRMSQSEEKKQEEEEKPEETITTSDSTKVTRGRPVPAAEAVPPVPVLDASLDVLNSHSSPFDFSLDFSLPPSSSPSDGLDFSLDLGPLPPAAADAARDPLIDSGLAAPAHPTEAGDVAQAWANWANQLDVSSLAAPPQPFLEPFEPVGEEEFDLFEFLRQDAAAGSAVEAVC